MQKKWAIFILIFVILSVIVRLALVCGLSDNKALQIANRFCQSLNIGIVSNPIVSEELFQRIKRVMYLRNGRPEVSADINCVNKDVVSFVNHKARDEVFMKYNIPIDNRKPRTWPALLPESKAKEIAFSYASKIGLPQDVVFSHMTLDKIYNGAWIAHWQRIHNGYLYEDDSLSVGIMAIDGEFYSYGKFFRGKPCPTDVKISKERAIEVGRRKLYGLLQDDKAKKHLHDYVVSSSELKIVQPNAVFGFLTPFHRSNSRLAWVVTYSLPSNDLKLEEDVNFADKFVIKVDAATGKFIGGSFPR